MMFKGIVIDKDESGYHATLQDIAESSLPDGDVTVRVGYSTLNYKDALAITGKAPVVRKFPMVPGIDLVGTVEQSDHPAFKSGDSVLLNGWGVTGRSEETDYLKSLGATEVLDRATFSEKGKPLGRERWAGAIDVAGGHTLTNICATTKYRGVVAACGLAESMDFPATVAPFILRGVTLVGIDSVMCPRPERLLAWERLSRDLEIQKLGIIVNEVPLAEAIPMAEKLLAGKIRGRVIVDVNA